MEQTGFLYKLDPKDYITGASPLLWENVNTLGDWRNFLPSEEKQYALTFDTLSCTTFSALNVIETFVNFLVSNNKLSVEKLNDLGFIENGKFNCSDRFSAILSGTTERGNYFPAVMDSIRKDGLLPEKDFPFSGTTWAEYHDKTKITEAMKEKAKKILSILDFAYEWVPITETSLELTDAFKQSPIQVAVTKESPTHAIFLPKIDWEFETYPPFLQARNRTIAYAMKIQVKVKLPIAPVYKFFSESEVAKWKLKPELFALLDKIRGECGFPLRIVSGLRSKAQNDALQDSVSDSSHLSSLAVDVFCNDSSRRFKIIQAALANGIKRIGVGKDFLHLDIATDKPQNVIWHYYK